MDKRRGNYIYSDKAQRDIWSCENCSWIHNFKVVDNIFSFIRDSSILQAIRIPLQADKTGIVILSHGSKLKQANKAILDIIRTIRKSLKAGAIEPASLQFHQPNLAKTIKKLADKGFAKIIIVPVFLLNGNHVTRDIPKAIEKEKAKYPGLKIIYTRNVGRDERISMIILDRIKGALG